MRWIRNELPDEADRTAKRLSTKEKAAVLVGPPTTAPDTEGALTDARLLAIGLVGL